MNLSRPKFLGTALASLGASLMPALSWAQSKLGDVTYPNEVTVGGQKLLLNGYGMRFRFGFRVYTAALYTPTKLTKNEDVLKPNIVKRMHLVAQRDVKGDEFGKLFTRAIEENMSKEDFSKIINGVIRMGNLFAEAKQFGKGDVILIDVIPGTGSLINFRGKQQGEPIKEPEFGQALMQIWFGKKPADEPLRKALLGEQSTANTNVN
ncbi:chalcone isomerase family protein [Variovorax sp. PCZ-1]|uniref:chalcone isomerase family protein n=1 Tax=Variovorax sp. PCZ-1 TaxID=2835533 RepID=UPI001BCD77D4|nr:chalcone isomerase family protein [Variovorax sp. PCZ-1]MBS7806203.1 chalcone isomerase family protein [Variovorax sp. PCZ-1]